MACCNKSIKPSLPKMASNFAGTMVHALSHAIKTGEILASDTLTKARILICNKCDRKLGVRCQECGCYVNKKAALLVSKCPLNRWPPSQVS